MAKFDRLMFKYMKRIFFGFCIILFASVSFSQSVSQNLQKAWQQFESDSQLKHAISSLYVIEIYFERERGNLYRMLLLYLFIQLLILFEIIYENCFEFKIQKSSFLQRLIHIRPKRFNKSFVTEAQ